MEGITRWTEYAGYCVKQMTRGEFEGRFLVMDLKRTMNMAPGATHFATYEDAMQVVDILKVVDGDGQKFWHLLRAINKRVAADVGPNEAKDFALCAVDNNPCA